MLNSAKLNTGLNVNQNLSYNKKPVSPFTKELNDTVSFKEKPVSILDGSDYRPEKKINWLQVTVGAVTGIIAGALLFRNKNGEKIQNLTDGLKDSSEVMIEQFKKADDKTLPILDKFMSPLVRIVTDKEPGIALKIQNFRIENRLAKIDDLIDKKSNIFDLCKKSEMDKSVAEQIFNTIKAKFPNEEQKLKASFDKAYK
ncbi:MAG: hypothetical protein PHC34_01745 [Candidatus Gastranaerophilales bacterium]|nr:hypothetical protein [Candidatus Gastranaerophilales bacterium]